MWLRSEWLTLELVGPYVFGELFVVAPKLEFIAGLEGVDLWEHITAAKCPRSINFVEFLRDSIERMRQKLTTLLLRGD
jgi:hypothetical protein